MENTRPGAGRAADAPIPSDHARRTDPARRHPRTVAPRPRLPAAGRCRGGRDRRGHARRGAAGAAAPGRRDHRGDRAQRAGAGKAAPRPGATRRRTARAAGPARALQLRRPLLPRAARRGGREHAAGGTAHGRTRAATRRALLAGDDGEFRAGRAALARAPKQAAALGFLQQQGAADDASQFAQNYFLYMVVAAVALVFAFKKYYATEKGTLVIDALDPEDRPSSAPC